ncbi:MAG: hypothetical protein ACOH2H_18975 [Cypionkella sp.]
MTDGWPPIRLGPDWHCPVLQDRCSLKEQRRSTAFDGHTFEEHLGVLVDREDAERDGKRLASRLKLAALRQASVEDPDLRGPAARTAML